MISTAPHIDARLKQITGNYEGKFGGVAIILIGDCQLTTIRATPIYKQTKHRIAGPTLLRSLNFYELNQVTKLADHLFLFVPTKIRNGTPLETTELD